MSADFLVEARALDARLTEIRRDHRRAEHPLAVLLAEMEDRRYHRALGYASITQYGAQALDLSPRQSLELCRIGRALPELPVLARTLAAGELDWTKAREIVTVATPETEEEWVARARSLTSRALEREVADASRGERPRPPDAPPPLQPPFRYQRWRFEASDLERVQQALLQIRLLTQATPGTVDDGVFLAAMATFYLEHALPPEPGLGAAEDVPIEDVPLEAVPLEAVPLEAVPPEAVPLDGVASHATPVVGRAPAAPGARPTPRQAPARHDAEPPPEPYRVVLWQCFDCRVTHGLHQETSDTVVAEACCDAETIDMRPGPHQGHASRTLPPALRRIVFCEARWSCSVPGCGNKTWLHIHHELAWAEGGRHQKWNLRVLCSVHHRAVHDGVISLVRLPSGASEVEHADGRRVRGPAPGPHVGAGSG